VAFATAAAQEKWGVEAPIGGRLFAQQRVPNGGTVYLADYRKGFACETEVAFTIGKQIDSEVADVAALQRCVRSVHTALDMPDIAFTSKAGAPKAPDVVAANAAAHRWAIGPAVDPAKASFSAAKARIVLDGHEVCEAKVGETIGDPWMMLLWQVNELVRRGFTVEPGQVILSGAVAEPYVPKKGFPADGTYVGSCRSLGAVAVKVAWRRPAE
jgi:2-keto-4-pentenoate hydratase